MCHDERWMMNSTLLHVVQSSHEDFSKTFILFTIYFNCKFKKNVLEHSTQFSTNRTKPSYVRIKKRPTFKKIWNDMATMLYLCDIYAAQMHYHIWFIEMFISRRPAKRMNNQRKRVKELNPEAKMRLIIVKRWTPPFCFKSMFLVVAFLGR